MTALASKKPKQATLSAKNRTLTMIIGVGGGSVAIQVFIAILKNDKPVYA